MRLDLIEDVGGRCSWLRRGTQVCTRWCAAHDEHVIALSVPLELLSQELPRMPARFPKVRLAGT